MLRINQLKLIPINLSQIKEQLHKATIMLFTETASIH